jgi:hypothetical protein
MQYVDFRDNQILQFSTFEPLRLSGYVVWHALTKDCVRTLAALVIE